MFRLDTILRKPVPLDLLQFDWVGEPWKEYIGGNGGLSIRNVDVVMKRIIDHTPYNGGGNEDGYLSSQCYHLGYKLADFETQNAFSIETVGTMIQLACINLG